MLVRSCSMASPQAVNPERILLKGRWVLCWLAILRQVKSSTHHKTAAHTLAVCHLGPDRWVGEAAFVRYICRLNACAKCFLLATRYYPHQRLGLSGWAVTAKTRLGRSGLRASPAPNTGLTGNLSHRLINLLGGSGERIRQHTNSPHFAPE